MAKITDHHYMTSPVYHGHAATNETKHITGLLYKHMHDITIFQPKLKIFVKHMAEKHAFGSMWSHFQFWFEAVSNLYPQSLSFAKLEKKSQFYILKFIKLS